MNKQQIKEMLENEEMEINESLYLKQLIYEADKQTLIKEQSKEYTEIDIKEFKEFLNYKYNKQMEQQTELEQISSMSVGDFLSYPNGEGANLSLGQEAVGLKFNPSGMVDVELAKLLSAKLIDITWADAKKKEKKKYDSISPSTTQDGTTIPSFQHLLSWQTNVFKTAAFNAIIAAQMAVVKFLTWSKI